MDRGPGRPLHLQNAFSFRVLFAISAIPTAHRRSAGSPTNYLPPNRVDPTTARFRWSLRDRNADVVGPSGRRSRGARRAACFSQTPVPRASDAPQSDRARIVRTQLNRSPTTREATMKFRKRRFFRGSSGRLLTFPCCSHRPIVFCARPTGFTSAARWATHPRKSATGTESCRNGETADMFNQTDCGDRRAERALKDINKSKSWPSISVRQGIAPPA